MWIVSPFCMTLQGIVLVLHRTLWEYKLIFFFIKNLNLKLRHILICIKIYSFSEYFDIFLFL